MCVSGKGGARKKEKIQDGLVSRSQKKKGFFIGA